jgi:phytoene dehydrogenase-like protein
VIDAVIVGSGPNGLAAAILLASHGHSVLVLEARDTIGGGARTEELTLPGFRHDICSAIHPMGVVSPYLRSLPLAQYGLEWAWSPAAIAHPLDDGTAATLQLSLDATAAGLGEDEKAYRNLMKPFAANASQVFDQILRPIELFPPPRHPFLLARFGLLGLQSAVHLVKRFRTPHARALFAGSAAHSFLPLDAAGSSSFGIAMMLAGHATGWPAAKGGSVSIINALAAHLRSLGGEIRTGHPVRSLRDVPESRVVLFDLSPRQLADIAGDALPSGYVKKLRGFRYGPGAFKVDFALDGPIPWKAADCARSATVHIGGTIEEIAAHEGSVFRGTMTDKPFVLCAQQSMFDATRAPEGKHTGWAYCHVPHGWTGDATELIEKQIERFAPGFRDRILARHTFSPAQYQQYNANFIGGDIAGGANVMAQFLTRPFPKMNPYRTPNERLFLCSSSTPPGGGVHGMCGYWAARSALRSMGNAEHVVHGAQGGEHDHPRA